jgi:hypothetical protein
MTAAHGWMAIALCLIGAPAAGDPPPVASSAAAPASTDDGPHFLVGVEVLRNRLHYRFENPSSFDTPFLVPHSFDQRYVADNVWATLTARYTAGVRWETSVGATPQRTGTGDDYDTFTDPDGSVIVSGTTGGVSVRSLRFSQEARFGPGRLQALVAYRFELDRFDFQLGHETVTRNGALEQAFDVTSPETTSSQVHEIAFGLSSTRRLAGAWRLSLTGDAAPVALGRLGVQLPDKYPGETLVFVAKALSASARMELVRGGHWPVAVRVEAGHAWSYGSAAELSRSQLGATVAIGHAW